MKEIKKSATFLLLHNKISSQFFHNTGASCVKKFLPKVKGLLSDKWSPFYAEFKNTIHCFWSGLVFRMRLNTSQVEHNNNIYSKAYRLYLSQLIVDAWCLV